MTEPAMTPDVSSLREQAAGGAGDRDAGRLTEAGWAALQPVLKATDGISAALEVMHTALVQTAALLADREAAARAELEALRARVLALANEWEDGTPT